MNRDGDEHTGVFTLSWNSRAMQLCSMTETFCMCIFHATCSFSSSSCLLPHPFSSSSCLPVHHAYPTLQKSLIRPFFPFPRFTFLIYPKSPLILLPFLLSTFCCPLFHSMSPFSPALPSLLPNEEASKKGRFTRAVISARPSFPFLSFCLLLPRSFSCSASGIFKSPLVIPSSRAERGNAAEQSHTPRCTNAGMDGTAACGGGMWNVRKPWNLLTETHSQLGSAAAAAATKSKNWEKTHTQMCTQLSHTTKRQKTNWPSSFKLGNPDEGKDDWRINGWMDETACMPGWREEKLVIISYWCVANNTRWRKNKCVS